MRFMPLPHTLSSQEEILTEELWYWVCLLEMWMGWTWWKWSILFPPIRLGRSGTMCIDCSSSHASHLGTSCHQMAERRLGTLVFTEELPKLWKNMSSKESHVNWYIPSVARGVIAKTINSLRMFFSFSVLFIVCLSVNTWVKMWKWAVMCMWLSQCAWQRATLSGLHHKHLYHWALLPTQEEWGSKSVACSMKHT